MGLHGWMCSLRAILPMTAIFVSGKSLMLLRMAITLTAASRSSSYVGMMMDVEPHKEAGMVDNREERWSGLGHEVMA